VTLDDLRRGLRSRQKVSRSGTPSTPVVASTGLAFCHGG